MIRSTFLLALTFCASLAVCQSPSPKDVNITAPDGVKLRATFFSAGKPGPAILLMHMCNTTRKSWEPVALGLSRAGINALTVDNRGFGESGGPRFDNPQVRQQLVAKWPADFERVHSFLIAQPGVDEARIAVGGGSCGVNNAVTLAEIHPEFRALVLLAGTTDVKGINYIADHPERPIFTAAADDDEYNPATVDIMRWTSDLSGNPRSKFSGFKDGRHGTEIFGPHPELVQQIVAFLIDTLVTTPVDLRARTSPRQTPEREFWTVVNQPGGAVKGAELYRQNRKRDSNPSHLFPEFALNLLGYARLQAGDNREAIELFKLNTEAYPSSANAQDSLSDAYLAAGQKDLALAAEEKCVELLPSYVGDMEFKAALEKQAREKIAKLQSEAK